MEIIMFHDYGMMNWGWGGLIAQLLFLIVIIVAVVWAIKFTTQHSKSKTIQSSEESALDILKRRYAQGEIDKKEFEEKKKDLI
jgi:putative membrane protein